MQRSSSSVSDAFALRDNGGSQRGPSTDHRGGAWAALATTNTPPGDGSEIGAFDARRNSFTFSVTSAVFLGSRGCEAKFSSSGDRVRTVGLSRLASSCQIRFNRLSPNRYQQAGAAIGTNCQRL
jgi:hypothetical protein